MNPSEVQGKRGKRYGVAAGSLPEILPAGLWLYTMYISIVCLFLWYIDISMPLISANAAHSCQRSRYGSLSRQLWVLSFWLDLHKIQMHWIDAQSHWSLARQHFREPSHNATHFTHCYTLRWQPVTSWILRGTGSFSIDTKASTCNSCTGNIQAMNQRWRLFPSFAEEAAGQQHNQFHRSPSLQCQPAIQATQACRFMRWTKCFQGIQASKQPASERSSKTERTGVNKSCGHSKLFWRIAEPIQQTEPIMPLSWGGRISGIVMVRFPWVWMAVLMIMMLMQISAIVVGPGASHRDQDDEEEEEDGDEIRIKSLGGEAGNFTIQCIW